MSVFVVARCAQGAAKAKPAAALQAGGGGQTCRPGSKSGSGAIVHLWVGQAGRHSSQGTRNRGKVEEA